MSTQITETAAEIQASTNPFPGLRPFEFDESHLFFGRDGQSEQLIGKLSRTHFLAVVGTSGSGKSSLVRAGFLPALQGGFMTSAGSAWRVAILRPGNDPIGNLARSLNAPDVFGSELEENAAIQTAIAESTLRRGSLGLVDTVRQAVMAGDENLLVVVDQFEEIFRFARVAEGEQYGNEAAAFIKLLLEASRQRDLPIFVVLTMRSDYLGDCSQFWGLPEAINESQYLIPRLTRDQLREAITGPVAVGGGKITPRLVNRLLNDVGDNQDQLPVLQHLLMRAWAEWKEKKLGIKETEDGAGRPHKEVHQGDAMDLCCADAVGGMGHALSRHADEAYSDLPDERHREVAEKVFKALTEKGPDNREIRRPITLGEICAITAASQSEVITVIDTFRQPGRSFVMPPADVSLNSESLIDISHESLIRGWMRLKDWVDEEARSARIYRRLAETAVLYKEGGAGLWRDPDLQIALAWREQGKPNEVWARRYHPEFALATDFLDESVTVRDAQAASDEARRRREIKRSRLTALIFGVAFLFSLAMGVYAYGAKNTAENQKKLAESAKEGALIQKKAADRAKEDALAQKATADTAKNEALAQKQTADTAKNEALDQKKAADTAKNDALAQKQTADTAKLEAQRQFEVAQAEALKGRALGALKDQKPDDAIKLFNELQQLYQNRQDGAGVSYALANIGDIHRDRAPMGIFAAESSNNSGAGENLFGDSEDDESQLMKQYVQMISVMSTRGDQDEDAMMEEFAKEARVAVDYYNQALQANQHTTGSDHYAKEGNILKNLGDLQVGLVSMPRNSKGSSAEKGSTTRELQTEIDRGIQYYTKARVAYKEGQLYSEEGDMLKKIGDVLVSSLSDKAAAKPTPTAASGQPQPTPDPMQDREAVAEMKRIIEYYDQASAAYQRANKPLPQAAMLARVGAMYEVVYKDDAEKSAYALRYLVSARDLYRSQKAFRREGPVDESLAELYGKLSDKNKEVASYIEAVDAYRMAALEPKAKADNATKADDMVKKVGGLLFGSSGKEKAGEFFEEAIARNGNDPASKARLLTSIGDFYKEKGDSAQAIKYYERKGQTWHRARKFLEEGNTLVDIGTMQNSPEQVAAAISSFDAARKAYGQIDLRAEQANDKSLHSTKLLDIAVVYAEHDKQKAVATYEEALQVELVNPNSYSQQRILREEGAILLELKTDEAKTKAQQLFKTVLEFYRGKQDSDNEATILISIGDLYKGAKESAEAQAYYDRARAIYLGKKTIYQLLNVLKLKGDLEVEQNPGRSLVEYYLGEAESAKRSGDFLSQGIALEATGNTYREKEKQKAVDYLEQARLAYHTAGLKDAEISVIRTMGYLQREMGNKVKAEQLGKQADEMSRPQQ
jgi:hypothetical protein